MDFSIFLTDFDIQIQHLLKLNSNVANKTLLSA